MDTLVMLVRKMDLLHIPLTPPPTVAYNDLYAFACLPPTAWIAVMDGPGDPGSSLVCHDAYTLATTQYARPVPPAVLALKTAVPAPRSDARHLDMAALKAFLPVHSIEELDSLLHNQ